MKENMDFYYLTEVSRGVFTAIANYKNGLTQTVFINLSEKGCELLKKQTEDTTLLLSHKHVASVQNKKGEEIKKSLLLLVKNYEVSIRVIPGDLTKKITPEFIEVKPECIITGG